MTDDEVKCPLCGGLSKISRSELIRVLTDQDLGNKIASYVAELSRGVTPSEEAVQGNGSDFQTQVHSWNPENPMWRRSNKE
jgi:hypothetical protein